jgi:hypothetical protein
MDTSQVFICFGEKQFNNHKRGGCLYFFVIVEAEHSGCVAVFVLCVLGCFSFSGVK